MLRHYSLHGVHVHVQIQSDVGLDELACVRKKMAGRFKSIIFTVVYAYWETNPEKAKHERAIEAHFHGIETTVQHKEYN